MPLVLGLVIRFLKPEQGRFVAYFVNAVAFNVLCFLRGGGPDENFLWSPVLILPLWNLLVIPSVSTHAGLELLRLASVLHFCAIAELRLAVTAWHTPPELVARALLVDGAYELDDEDVAAAVIQPGETVVVAWARATAATQPHDTLLALQGPSPLTNRTSSGQLTGRSDSGGLPSVCEDDGDGNSQFGAADVV